jgi:hypothetical protein
MRKFLLSTICRASLAACFAAGLAAPAYADIIFQPGPPPGGIGEVNVLFQAPEQGTSLDHATVDHSTVGVLFDSLTQQQLNQKAEGQADIFCASNCVSNGGGLASQLTSIEMKAGINTATGANTAWTDVEFNLDSGIGTVKIEATDNFDHTFTMTLSKGENKGLLLATVDSLGQQEFITDVKFTNAVTGAAFGFDSFKQPRVSGTCDLVTATSCVPVTITTPEPMTLAVLGTGLLGLGIVRRNRKEHS